MLTVSHLYIFPIKSLRGISVSSATVTDRGFEHDRRWMLVDPQNRFLTLREFPQMARLQPSISEDGLTVSALDQPVEDVSIPFNASEGQEEVTIWNAICKALRVAPPIDDWFSKRLDTPCHLVFMPDTTMRPVDTTSGYAPEGKFTSFADAYPFLMLGEASLDDLNSRLPVPVSMLRFRPNIVFSGGAPYQEDEIEAFNINQVHFTGLENCARCQIPNVDPDTGVPDSQKQPLRTLAQYRTQDKKINFGRNVVHTGTGTVRVGDEIRLL